MIIATNIAALLLYPLLLVVDLTVLLLSLHSLGAHWSPVWLQELNQAGAPWLRRCLHCTAKLMCRCGASPAMPYAILWTMVILVFLHVLLAALMRLLAVGCSRTMAQ